VIVLYLFYMHNMTTSNHKPFPLMPNGTRLEAKFLGILVCDHRSADFVQALPSNGAPLPLSTLAWRMAEPNDREWATLGELDPWTLKPTCSAPSVRGREKALREEAMRACFGNAAWFDLLPQLVDHDVRVSGVLASGRRVVLDDATLSQLVVDLATDTARTYDGRTVWRALTVSA
jgi:hypothetical protein